MLVESSFSTLEELQTGAIISSVVFLSSRDGLHVSMGVRQALAGRGDRVPESALILTFGLSSMLVTDCLCGGSLLRII